MILDGAREIIRQAIHQNVFPAAAVDVGDERASVWREAFGTLTFDKNAQTTSDQTLFDLASLTKPIATTTVAMDLVSRRLIALGAPVAEFFPEWRGDDREAATVQDLLEHASGLAARLIDQPPEGRREFEHEICAMRLEYRPRERSLYSDLGFILLAFLLEDRGQAPLDVQFDRMLSVASGLSRTSLGFGVLADDKHLTAPTWPLDEDRRRGRMLAGEVHDNYAAALGGVAGHAGLFGTAAAVGAFARTLLKRAREGELAIAKKSAVPGSSRALGWDTMLPTSSCGRLLSPAAFGHTGFTGASLWIDPVLDRYFVLLTNRACRGGTLEQMQTVRRAFHDVVAKL